VPIAHLDPENTQNDNIPDYTYAYTVFDPYSMSFDRIVLVKSFWLRLHRGKELKENPQTAFKSVRVYLDGEIVAESSVILTSNEWIMLT